MAHGRITGWATHLPEKRLTNHDLAEFVDTTDEWIRERSGISARHVGGKVSEMSTVAGRDALAMAGVDPGDVGLLLLATCSSEQQLPASASIVQHDLGLKCGAIDINAACSGFVYGLVTAMQFAAGGVDTILLIGSDALSGLVDWTDRGTCVLFGDGAGAVVIQRSADSPTMLGWDLMSDGSAAGILSCEHGGKIFMNGKEVFRRAVLAMESTARNAMETAGVVMDDIALVVPHQANIRIIDAAMKRLAIPREKAAMVLERTGNTSAASIPLALVDALDNNRVAPGDLVLMVGFGAGMSSAAAVIRWDPPSS
ncbi:MAG: ketoacyl-ACP synthase III [Acidimicrobiales bacterium]|jgi:3-oxoacyl-[acyl-carrier-protein] synthase III|nr:ketoacyl-ACP synthase III [Acidimicrobiaceae bacterium]MBT5207530.1 ketoacyl-ACP synthase III [Acidimicrobiaceae bacterium]MBT5569373.1 ketoacyl-ACP synthase III [Acidimicrobiaceae bacterium]MBT6091994.1 ketoacyl-ACP synthase III [Acidimicrobiaceae bacterium]MDG2160058.1 ketoacyl-ACP synthase III [Acidimicrobiales bacterium]